MKTLIEKYYSGELSGVQMNALEKEALTDPFLADAMEGLELVSKPDTLHKLNEEFKGRNSFGYSAWFKGIIGFAIVAGGFILFQIVNSTNQLAEEPVSQIPEKAYSKNETPERVELNQNLSENPIPKKELIVVQSEKLPQEKFEWKENAEIAEPPSKMNPVSVPNRIELEEHENKTSLKKLRRSNMAVEYMHDLKVINYGKIYRTSILVDRSVKTGTPANIETHPVEHGVNISFESKEWVPYMEFLESNMALVKNEKYKQALREFKIIFANFPNDGNAMFYSGLCHYHLEEYTLAIDQFNAIINHDANTFNEEAKWYKLLSLKASNQETPFQQLRQEIINDNGFYAERAKQITR